MNTEQETHRIEISVKDPKTGVISRRVIAFPSKEFLEIVPKLIDKEDNGTTAKFVENSVPLGNRGKGKVFRYRTSHGQYFETVINYEIIDNEIKFIDFEPMIIDDYTVDVRHSKDGDLLEIDLGKERFAPTDSKEVSRISRLLRYAQKFNNELINETMDEDDSDSSEEEQKNGVGNSQANNFNRK